MSIHQLIHANTHRVKEGARVLEDLARFVLRDEDLFKQIRALRHSLKALAPDAADQADLGGPELPEHNLRANIIDLVQANALRIQEALRVLEEFSENAIAKHRMKTLRYEAYRLQQQLYHQSQLYLRQNKLQGLYLIIDTDLIPRSLEEIIEIINQTPVQVIQLRSKRLEKRAFIQQALELRQGLNPEKLFLINNEVDIALDLADGVHLGQVDYPLERVRQLAPKNFIIGTSCHTVPEALGAQHAGASYISVGCLFPTHSKTDVTPTSLDELQRIRQAIHLPLCAIGGINAKNLPQLLSQDINLVALLSAPWQNTNPIAYIQTLCATFSPLKLIS